MRENDKNYSYCVSHLHSRTCTPRAAAVRAYHDLTAIEPRHAVIIRILFDVDVRTFISARVLRFVLLRFCLRRRRPIYVNYGRHNVSYGRRGGHHSAVDQRHRTAGGIESREGKPTADVGIAEREAQIQIEILKRGKRHRTSTRRF